MTAVPSSTGTATAQPLAHSREIYANCAVVPCMVKVQVGVDHRSNVIGAPAHRAEFLGERSVPDVVVPIEQLLCRRDGVGNRRAGQVPRTWGLVPASGHCDRFGPGSPRRRRARARALGRPPNPRKEQHRLGPTDRESQMQCRREALKPPWGPVRLSALGRQRGDGAIAGVGSGQRRPARRWTRWPAAAQEPGSGSAAVLGQDQAVARDWALVPQA